MYGGDFNYVVATRWDFESGEYQAWSTRKDGDVIVIRTKDFESIVSKKMVVSLVSRPKSKSTCLKAKLEPIVSQLQKDLRSGVGWIFNDYIKTSKSSFLSKESISYMIWNESRLNSKGYPNLTGFAKNPETVNNNCNPF